MLSGTSPLNVSPIRFEDLFLIRPGFIVRLREGAILNPCGDEAKLERGPRGLFETKAPFGPDRTYTRGFGKIETHLFVRRGVKTKT